MKSTLVKIIRSPLCMVLAAFLVRVVYSLITRSYHFVGLWDMFEPANLARSLATGRGYSDPYVATTGPSALIAPVYPWITSLVFRAFGVFSYGSGFAMVVFNSIFSALTCWTVYRIAHRVFNETVAVWSGWLWASSPFAIYYSVDWIWESTLSAFLLSVLFLLTLEMEGNARLTSWLTYGVLWGIAGLTNTAELAWLPFSGCWLAYQLHRRGKRFLTPVLLGAAVFWITLSPWLVRNYVVFGKMVFIRDNFGNEFRSGNNPLSQGVKVANYDMAANGQIFAVYQHLGEIEINKKQADEGKEWVAQHPQRFVELCLLRFYYFWGGIPEKYDNADDPFAPLRHLKNLLFLASSLLAVAGLVLAIKKRVHATFLFATVLVFYPLTYYISVTELRYRHAIEPELLILSVYLLWSVAVRFLPHRQPVQDEVMV